MEHAAVVPQGQIPRLPGMLEGARGLAGLFREALEQRPAVLLVLANDVAGVPAKIIRENVSSLDWPRVLGGPKAGLQRRQS